MWSPEPEQIRMIRQSGRVEEFPSLTLIPEWKSQDWIILFVPQFWLLSLVFLYFKGDIYEVGWVGTAYKPCPLEV